MLTLLKIGTYALLNLTDVPKFAIVSECVEVAKSNGKGGASGFINAVLKKVADGKYSLPKESDENYLSVTYSKPQWFCDKLENNTEKRLHASFIRKIDYARTYPNKQPYGNGKRRRVFVEKE